MIIKCLLASFVSFVWTMAGIELINFTQKIEPEPKSLDIIELKTDQLIKNDCLIDSLIKIDSINVF